MKPLKISYTKELLEDAAAMAYAEEELIKELTEAMSKEIDKRLMANLYNYEEPGFDEPEPPPAPPPRLTTYKKIQV